MSKAGAHVKKIIAFLTTLCLVWVVSAQDEPRTQYESFDLSTPESAAQTFLDLFDSRDYAGVFLVFAPETQDAWYQANVLLTLERILLEPSLDTANALIERIGFDHTETEHSSINAPYLFDTVMLYAEQNDLFLIDLRGETEIVRTEDSSVPARRNAEDREDDENRLPAVDVIVSTEQHGEVRFRMVQALSGRWRVYQVIVPGGDEAWIPWAVKTGDSEN